MRWRENRIEKDPIKNEAPNPHGMMNPIMILQVKHFIHFVVLGFVRKTPFWSPRPSRTDYNSRQTGRKISSRHDIGDVPSFHSVFIFFFPFFLLRESECKGCRNEEGTSVHNSKTSSPSASTRIVLSSSRHARRFSFVPRVSRCSRHSRNEEKRNSRSKSSERSFLSDITFILFRASTLPGRCPCSSILSSTSRFVSSRLYRPRVRDQNWSESPRNLRPTVSLRAVQFPRQERAVYIPLYHQHKVSHCHELKDKQKRVELCVLRVDFQFEDSGYKLIAVSVCHDTQVSYEYVYTEIMNIFTLKLEVMYNCETLSAFRTEESFAEAFRVRNEWSGENATDRKMKKICSRRSFPPFFSERIRRYSPFVGFLKQETKSWCIRKCARLTLTRVTRRFSIALGLPRREDAPAEIYPIDPAIGQESRGWPRDEREKQRSKVDRKGRTLPDVIPQIRSGFRSSEHDRRRIICVRFVRAGPGRPRAMCGQRCAFFAVRGARKWRASRFFLQAKKRPQCWRRR